MKETADHCVVWVTAPDAEVARGLARAALEARLVACANVVPQVESHYWWQGRIEISGELLVMFKTRRDRLAALERLVMERHPYDTPEFVVLPVGAGSERYLDWIDASMAISPPPGPPSSGPSA
ncbi:MAG: divalent-cation tolerance protein CutA [Verrucomicrobiae bacterium]|nr:divalent-cation tolerance protein CutA [Verrucomicrobiae bacterium]